MAYQSTNGAHIRLTEAVILIETLLTQERLDCLASYGKPEQHPGNFANCDRTKSQQRSIGFRALALTQDNDQNERRGRMRKADEVGYTKYDGLMTTIGYRNDWFVIWDRRIAIFSV